LTPKQQRERAHAEREPRQRAEVKGPVRRAWLKRLGIFAGIVAGTIVLIVIASGCSSKQGATKPSKAQPQVAGAKRGTGAEVAAQLAGIPQRGNTLGDPRAPVTVQFFGDLQCPYCRPFTLEVLPSLIQSYVRPGKLKIAYRSRRPATGASRPHRVLRPGGRLLFIEHVRSDDERLARWQDRLNGLQTRIGHGCNCNRSTIAAMIAAGFSINQLHMTCSAKRRPMCDLWSSASLTPRACVVSRKTAARTFSRPL